MKQVYNYQRNQLNSYYVIN